MAERLSDFDEGLREKFGSEDEVDSEYVLTHLDELLDGLSFEEGKPMIIRYGDKEFEIVIDNKGRVLEVLEILTVTPEGGEEVLEIYPEVEEIVFDDTPDTSEE